MPHSLVVESIGARGLLIIGDLHLTSSRPSRRRAGYAEAILGKLKRCLEIAARERLVPVLLGDVYHAAIEADEALKATLSEILASSWTTPLCNTGNHDKAGVRLQRCDSLWTLHASRLLRVAMDSGPVALMELEDGGERAVIGIGMTPHGQGIPDSVEGVFGDAADGVIWMTHHDLGFKGAYMKTHPLREIEGCGIAVNGHMHHTRAFEEHGQTTWCNFGSLARTSTDEADHVPLAMGFFPLRDDLFTRWEVEHESDAFDLSARLAPTSASAESASGEFVEMLVNELASAAAQTPSGAVLQDELTAFLDEGRRPLARKPILDLLARAIKAEEGSVR